MFFLHASAGCAHDWDVLSEAEKNTVQKILGQWEKWVPERQKDGTAPLMTYRELYDGLGREETAFLDRIRAIETKSGPAVEEVQFKRIENQKYSKGDKEEILGPQYLPEQVFTAYEKMMSAMQSELGKRLLVESGYRSPAYQLYNFLFYMPKHGYSIKETRRWVALPGHSEHGNPARQAIDFISDQGVNGEDRAEDFEALPEFSWLVRHASDYGFELSYPRGTQGTTYEPWHWRFTRSGDKNEV